MTLAAWAGAAAFSWLAVFQTLLALGLPLGRLAWGGAAARLTLAQRLASLAVVPLAGLGAVACLQVLGWAAPVREAWLGPLLWGFAGLFAVSFVGNALSSSRPERLHGVPLALILCGTSLRLALGLSGIV